MLKQEIVILINGSYSGDKLRNRYMTTVVILSK